MRYILDGSGYVYDASLGAAIMCDLGNCTEYTGKIPSGYTTIDEWLIEEAPRLNAWKIVDGNLIFDRDRAAELERICNEQAELNRHVTYGEVRGMLNNLDITVSNKNEIEGILPIRTEEGEVIYLDDSSSYPVEKMTLRSKDTIADNLNIYISTSNMLPNKMVNGFESNVTYTVNEDKSISLAGNLTDNFRVTVSGDATNTVPLFIFKAGFTYYINEVSKSVSLNLYTNDGTDRTLVYLGNGAEAITFEEDTAITHVEISMVGSGNLITENEENLLTENGLALLTENSVPTIDETIYLMVSVGNTPKTYEPCFYNIVPIKLYNNTFELDEVMTIEWGLVQIGDTGVDIIDMPCTYYEKTTMYTDKGTVIEVDYKKSNFDMVNKSGRGALNLKNTADGYGSIFNFTIENLTGGAIYTLESSNGDELTEQYTIDLTDYTGSVDIVIEGGITSVYQDDVCIGELENIYIRTYSPRTYIELVGCTNRMTCKYMVESDFSIYCTRVEKDASIKMVEDMIQLEVKRASGVEGELTSQINIEAGRIEQIVSSVGNSKGKVTPASIVASINDASSSVKISADHVDVESTVFPTISNTEGTCTIDTLFNNAQGDGIEYTADAMHVFNGSVIVNPNLNMYGLQVRDTSGDEVFRTADTFVNIGNASTEVRIYGKVRINGTLFDGIAKFG